MSFPQYPEYKDSGVEWLGDVPSDWRLSKLGYFFSEPPCYGVLVPDFMPNGVPMLRITDMEHENIDKTGLTTISPDLSSQYARTIVRKGDVVLSLVGTIGKAFEVTSQLAGVNLSRAVARLQIKSDTLPRYLCWIFQSDAFKHFTDLVCKGTAQRVLNISDLTAFRFTFPPYADQIAISHFLDHETSRIDALVEEQQRLIALLKEKRQAVISHAVTKGLDPDVPMKDSGVEWLGEVPAHWEVMPLGLLAHKIQTGPFGSQLHSHEYVEGQVPVVNPSNIKGGRIVRDNESTVPAETAERLAHQKLEAGELVFGRRGEMGRCATVTEAEGGWLCGTGSMKVALSSRMNPEFVALHIRTPVVRELLQLESVGSTMDNLNPEILARTRVPVPPIHQQNTIVSAIEETCASLDALLREAGEGVSLLKERRSALISAAVTGKIDVRGWAPPSDVAPAHQDARMEAV
ncbi:restriction endonuclease subunit S [Onishia niordana]|uniref:restriction endonuclease subunit S n=1 Tax=Onishia niordana TaxID=2508711 RepID=UPI00109F0ED6|nr:restriction endonuclease subunit S [Halomonas niordiana]